MLLHLYRSPDWIKGNSFDTITFKAARTSTENLLPKESEKVRNSKGFVNKNVYVEMD